MFRIEEAIVQVILRQAALVKDNTFIALILAVILIN